MKITKAIIPAAGLGTRFLPITKSLPKEMLPLLNIPALHYIIREGHLAGIKDFSFILSHSKTNIIKSYFTQDPLLDLLLKKNNKETLLNDLPNLIEKSNFSYLHQNEPLGLGHAILCGKDSINKDFFSVFLPDDIIYNANYPAIGQLIDAATQHKATIIAIQKVPKNAVSQYGIIDPLQQINKNTWQIKGVIEKPSPDIAPSQFAIIGRYIFSPIIFDYLSITKPGKNGEIQLTDAIASMIQDNHTVLAYELTGKRFDLGSAQGWLAANNFLQKKLTKH